MEFKNIFPSTAARPPSNYARGVNVGPQKEFVSGMPRLQYLGLRDLFHPSTILLLGAAAQSLALLLLRTRWALAPAVALLAWRLLDTALVAAGVRRNALMDGVLMGKLSAQLPDGEGRYGGTPARESVCVFLIGSRNNHPLGPFAPGAKQLGTFFVLMIKELEKNAEEYGYLGGQTYLETERATANGVLVILHFRDVAALHAYAHGRLHREAWDWWNATVKRHPHLGIYHETLQVPGRGYESVYIQQHAVGMGALSIPGHVKDAQGERRTEWFSPLVDASRGRLRSSAGRMARDDGTGAGNEKYGEVHYDGA